MRTVRVLVKSLIDFWWDDCFTHAASISFFALMSLFPLLIIIISALFPIFGTNEDVSRNIVPFLKIFFPHIDQSIIKEIKRLSGVKGFSDAINAALFLWMAIQVFYSIEYAVNIAFKTKKPRTFIYTTTISVFMVFFSGILYLFSIGITSLTKILKTAEIDLIGIPYIEISINFLFIHDTMINYLIPFLLVFISLIWLYKFLPNKKVRINDAISGAFLTAIFWEAAKHIFTWYVGEVADYKSLYGSLTTIIVFLLWIYYSASILLFGAEVIFNLGTPLQAASGKRNRRKQQA
ncbi:MAG: YihY/virulence factor BrkB family protein [Nitrospirota bacterium]